MIGSGNLAGTTLGNYELQSLIGVGGMASVYRALDRNLRRPVAVKVLSEAVAQQPGFAGRFLQEARLIASLRHPNIVQVYDFGEQNGRTYMVQELLPGPTLEQRLRDLAARGERMPRDEILVVAQQLAAALDAAHAAGIIHRDVKPANALWNAAGALALTDFGIAKNTVAPGNHTQAGMVVGTPEYLSPEQAQGQPLSPASDIYSFGAVLYELLAGRPPFRGEPLGVVMSHIQDAPAPLRSFRPDLPADVERVIEQALAKDPAARFRSARVLVQALERAWPAALGATASAPVIDIHSQPTRVWVAPGQSRAPQPPAVPVSPAVPPQPQPPAPQSRSRRSPVLPLLGALLAALLLGGAALAWRGSRIEDAAPASTSAPAAVVPTAAPTAAPTDTPQPTAAPTAAPQPTAAPVLQAITPAPTVAPTDAPVLQAVTPAPKPTSPPAPADPVAQLRALFEADRAGSYGDKLLADLNKAQEALAKGDKKRAADRLRDLQKDIAEGQKDGEIDAAFAREALDGVASIADRYELKLPGEKGKD